MARTIKKGSPRYLVQRHFSRSLSANSDGKDAKLAPGYERLKSFFQPGLTAGPYSINATQKIEVKGYPPKEVPTEQSFTAWAPQFNLPTDAIYSKYPAESHAERAIVLPHVVFSNEILPWQRIASWKTEELPPEKRPEDWNKNKTPWLALMVFTQQELQLQESELKGPDSIFKKSPTLKDGASQTQTWSVKLPVADVPSLDRVSLPHTVKKSMPDNKDSTEIIIIKKRLFDALFATYANDGMPLPGQKSPDVSRYKYTAHVRHMNSAGTAEAGVEDTQGSFSIVLAHRTGPLSLKEPTPVYAHLVSIEGIEDMDTFPIDKSYGTLISLHSWTYTCLPNDSKGSREIFEDLGKSLDILHPSRKPASFKMVEDPVSDRVSSRLDDGFSLLRWRPQSGEETLGFMRGPLTPTHVQCPLGNLLKQPSKTGTNLQILDQKLGIMDITYSTAWQLGRTLALSDQAFSAALSRLRKYFFDKSTNKVRSKIFDQAGIPVKTKETLIKSLGDTIAEIGGHEVQSHTVKSVSMQRRWYHGQGTKVNLSCQTGDWALILEQALKETAMIVSGTRSNSLEAFDEFNDPFSTDWAIVFRWMLDRLFLAEVPGHYLITDPTHLPLESLRFFYVDSNWVKAFLDGGLSLADHIENHDDGIRKAIKAAFDRYLISAKNATPRPRYGFILRSQLVSQFPDLVIKLYNKGERTMDPYIVRHELLWPGVMLCYLSQPPEQGKYDRISIGLPPHQQNFVAAAELTTADITMSYRRVYTVKDPKDVDRAKAIDETKWFRDNTKNSDRLNERGVPFIWGSSSSEDDLRLLNVHVLAKDVYDVLHDRMNKLPDAPKEGWFSETMATAALLGLQLNDPCWELDLDLDLDNGSGIKCEELFQLSPDFRLLDSQSQSVLPEVTKPPPLSLKNCDPCPLFEERRRVRRLRSGPPSHYRTIQPILLPEIPIIHTFDPAHLPEFKFAMYSTLEPTRDKVQTLDEPQDLIFSILYVKGAQEFLLKRMTILLPLEKSKTPLLDSYQGPGAKILSNLRFNTRVQFSDKEGVASLAVSLLPRSRRGWVPVKDIHDLSFLLNEAIIHSYSEPRTVTVQVTIDYVSGSYPAELYIDLIPEKASVSRIGSGRPPSSSNSFSSWVQDISDDNGSDQEYVRFSRSQHSSPSINSE